MSTKGIQMHSLSTQSSMPEYPIAGNNEPIANLNKTDKISGKIFSFFRSCYWLPVTRILPKEYAGLISDGGGLITMLLTARATTEALPIDKAECYRVLNLTTLSL